jgi:hypothetical protein
VSPAVSTGRQQSTSTATSWSDARSLATTDASVLSQSVTTRHSQLRSAASAGQKNVHRYDTTAIPQAGSRSFVTVLDDLQSEVSRQRLEEDEQRRLM